MIYNFSNISQLSYLGKFTHAYSLRGLKLLTCESCNVPNSQTYYSWMPYVQSRIKARQRNQKIEIKLPDLGNDPIE